MADDTKPKKPKKLSKEDREILDEALDRFEDIDSRDSDNRDAAEEDTRFVYIAGEQWPTKWKKEREQAEDPCLEFPQLKQFVNQVVNEQRQNRPGIRVHPAAGKASVETATILQGLVRHIEYESNAEAAYDAGFQHAVVGGRGYWRVISEYEPGKSFNQRLAIKRIPDPRSVYMDIDFQEPDGSDARFAFVTQELQQDEFDEIYPDAEPLSWQPTSKTSKWYAGKDKVVVADYYRRVCDKRTLVMLSDGSTAWEDEVPEGAIVMQDRDGKPIEREADDYRVEWYTLAGGEQIIARHDCPGPYIPVVCCMGDEIMIDGERVFQGLIRQAKDGQMMYNFSKSQEANQLALAPRNPWIVAEESIEQYTDQWANANVRNYSSLVYRAFDKSGRPLPPPQRVFPPPIGSGFAEAAASNKEDIKSVIGMYQASLGMQGQEVSGRAINARERQSDNATFHFADNLARAIALTGRIIVSQVPTIYDTKRLVTIVGTDDARSNVTINDPQPQLDGYTAIIQNDLTTGEYSVTVESGPSYATKRQEASDTMLQLVQSDPAIMQVAGDIVVGNMDFEDADKLAARLKLAMPPQIQQAIAQEEAAAKPGQPGQPTIPPAVQAQMQQMGQQLQGMQQQMQALAAENQQLKSGAAEKARIAESEGKTKEAIAKIDAGTKLQVAELDNNTKLILAGVNPEALKLTLEQTPGLTDIMHTIIALANEVAGVKQIATAKRQHRFIMDANGEVVGGESWPAQAMPGMMQ